MKTNLYLLALSACAIYACTPGQENQNTATDLAVIQPVVITDTVANDTDDPAIWINKKDMSKSIIIGTDKDIDGGLYAFDLNGKIIDSLVIKGLKRPNNVDVGYGLILNNDTIDYAVVSERKTSRLRFYSLPSLQPLDSMGVEIFEGETGNEFRDLMGIATYFDNETGTHYVIAGRKNGKSGEYLWQYKIGTSPQGTIALELVRKFGIFGGGKEIEAIAVDNELGYVYYSDEGKGVRKYHAQPEKGNDELALFATEGFADDHEGISILKFEDGTGYILVSDQQSNQFHIFPREGTEGMPNNHPVLKIVKLATLSSDGSEIANFPFNDQFKNGLFVAMSEGKVFHYYRWEDLAGTDLKIKPTQINP